MNKPRPNFILDEHLEYLDDLRQSGITNMFGASTYLKKVFPELNISKARAILVYWMETFGKKDR